MIRAPIWLFLEDVLRDGRVLLATNLARGSVACLPPGEGEERELGWLEYSEVQALCPDGKYFLQRTLAQMWIAEGLE